MRRYETDNTPLRDQLPALAKEGLTISAAARRLGAEIQTVSYWSKRDGVKMAKPNRHINLHPMYGDLARANIGRMMRQLAEAKISLAKYVA
jgi:hypothetical protein